MGTQMLAVTDVIELHYTTITPELLLDRRVESIASLLSSKSWGIVPQKPQLYPKFWGFFLSGGVRLYIIPEIPGCAIIPDKY